MREKLNENPMAQVALVAVLLVLAAVFLLGKMGGTSEEEGAEEPIAPATTTSTELSTGPVPKLPAPGSGLGSAPAPPADVVRAFDANKTVVLLFVRRGGIDDRLVTRAASRLGALPTVASFVVPSDRIAHYVSIAQGVDLNRLPALVVVRPKHLTRGVPTASVQYGFQSAESIVQAVVDASYHGGTLAYHP
jgi:hypothetical protein